MPHKRSKSDPIAYSRLTPRWSGRVLDKVPSSYAGVRAGQLNRQAAMKRQRLQLNAFALVLFSMASLVVGGDKPRDTTATDGIVPNAQTAIRIAVAVWEPIYGAAPIAAQKPYRARLEKGVWIVEGTLHSDLGGVAVAEISKSDGRVLRVSHGR
jgi:hypothetical protein